MSVLTAVAIAQGAEVAAWTDRAGAAVPASPAQGSRAAPVGGCWNLVVETPFPLPDQRGRFAFVVQGSSLRGAVTLRGDTFEVRRGVVKGRSLEFVIGKAGSEAVFVGALDGAVLRGTMTRSSKRLAWTATRCASGT